MPIIKSAKKAVTNSARKRVANQTRRKNYKAAVKAAHVDTSATKMSAAHKALDKAAKAGTIHRNKASRLKSRLAKAAAKATA